LLPAILLFVLLDAAVTLILLLIRYCQLTASRSRSMLR
jgi:hypothetical protein